MDLGAPVHVDTDTQFERSLGAPVDVDTDTLICAWVPLYM